MGNKPITLLFLVSGNGGLLRFIYYCVEKNILPQYRIISVIADRACSAIDFSKKHGIACCIVSYDKDNRDDLFKKMESVGFDFAITTFRKILDERICQRFSGKLINVHPSFLPLFKGFNAIKNALASGVKFLGTTVHHVNKEVDSGEIIAQSMTPIVRDFPLDIITDSQFRAWCLNLLNVLIRTADESAVDMTDSYQKTTFNPPLCFDVASFDEDFWNRIKYE